MAWYIPYYLIFRVKQKENPTKQGNTSVTCINPFPNNTENQINLTNGRFSALVTVSAYFKLRY
jgi:hypothetical protein